jgi:flagellar basal body-associated protein FliL
LEQDIKLRGERNWKSLAFWRRPRVHTGLSIIIIIIMVIVVIMVVVVMVVMYILFFAFSDGWQEDGF